MVLREASVSTARVPSYAVTPTTRDPEDIGAARLSEKVALFGHNEWHIREAARDAVIHAVVAGEAFAWVYFDNTIGPFIGDEDGDVGVGDVRVRIFGANECYWEPGLRFYDSPWHAVEHARPIEQVMDMPGYVGPKKLTPDAEARALSNRGKGRASKSKLVIVTEYLERPCPKYPQGRWLTMANDQEILQERPYPGTGSDPCLRKLSYAPDPDADRDLGLVPQLIDAQRTVNDSTNKAIEWKNLCLLPRIVVTPGLFKKQRWTDEPGKVYEIPQPEQNFKVVETPQVPQELFEMADRAGTDIDRIAASGPRDASQIESGKEAQVYDAQAAGRKQAFLADLADWYSRVMHDCLVQTQNHYTEPRLLQIRGRFGPESIEDFQGAQLRNQVDIRVQPDSIEPRTKQAIEQRVMGYAQLGWVNPEQAMAAINAGTAEGLIDSYELAYARVNRVIQRIKDGSFMAMGNRPVLSSEEHYVPAPPVIDPLTGEEIPALDEFGQPQMVLATEVPEWMPRPFDNIRVHKQQMEDWMQTSDWDDLDAGGKEAGNLYYQALLDLEAQQAKREAMMQQEQAAGLGMANAAKPQAPSPLPSLPAGPSDSQ